MNNSFMPGQPRELYYASARLVRSTEFRGDPVIGARELRGLIPGRATLELDASGDGWRVRATVANSPIEEKASAQKMIQALKTAITLVEARMQQEEDSEGKKS